MTAGGTHSRFGVIILNSSGGGCCSIFGPHNTLRWFSSGCPSYELVLFPNIFTFMSQQFSIIHQLGKHNRAMLGVETIHPPFVVLAAVLGQGRVCVFNELILLFLDLEA